MPTYHYDILEPDSDLTIAVDNLQHELGALYKESYGQACRLRRQAVCLEH